MAAQGETITIAAHDPTAAEVAREVFPDLSDDETNAIAWAHTGYPAFWAKRDGETWIDCFRRQLEAYRDGRCECLDCRPDLAAAQMAQADLGTEAPRNVACARWLDDGLREATDRALEDPRVDDAIKRLEARIRIGGTSPTIEWGDSSNDRGAIETVVAAVLLSVSQRTVDDGHGNEWPKCGRVDCDLHVCRPGKAQCNHPECPEER